MEIQNTTATTFQSGLTKQMAQEIRHIRPEQVSAGFRQYGIQTDFKNNKAFAWCALKCLNLIQTLNKQYGLNLALPKGIFVEDFFKLDINSPDRTFGFCNLFPVKLYKNNNTIIPEQTLCFNEIIGDTAEEIDAWGDYLADSGDQPDSYFLTPILHEFTHAIHEGNMINKLGAEKFHAGMTSINLEKFLKKYFLIIYRNLYQYAATSPLETVACDLTKRFLGCIDKTTISPVKNPVKHSPYSDSIFPMITKFDRILKRFWNGNFD